MRLVAQISQKAHGSFRACCPALPGCVVYARSRSEAKAKIQEAVCGYIASLDVALPCEISKLVSVQGS